MLFFLNKGCSTPLRHLRVDLMKKISPLVQERALITVKIMNAFSELLASLYFRMMPDCFFFI